MFKTLQQNKDIAIKVYNQQLKKLNKPENEKDKQDILIPEKKLQDLGFIDYTHNLSNEQQEMLKHNSIQNYIPWRAVWKPSSLSTPCRIVFDGSQPTPSGYTLNDILAKGTNNLYRLAFSSLTQTDETTKWYQSSSIQVGDIVIFEKID